MKTTLIAVLSILSAYFGYQHYIDSKYIAHLKWLADDLRYRNDKKQQTIVYLNGQLDSQYQTCYSVVHKLCFDHENRKQAACRDALSYVCEVR